MGGGSAVTRHLLAGSRETEQGDGPDGTRGPQPSLPPRETPSHPLPSIRQPHLVPQINLFPYQSCKQEAALPPRPTERSPSRGVPVLRDPQPRGSPSPGSPSQGAFHIHLPSPEMCKSNPSAKKGFGWGSPACHEGGVAAHRRPQNLWVWGCRASGSPPS